MRLSQRRQEALADLTVGLSLHAMKEAYEANFSDIQLIEMPRAISLSMAPPPQSIIHNGPYFEHHEIIGTGDTDQEAMDDWKSWLDKCPQTGKKLLWRVPPEIDCWCDFPTDKLIWKVYARLVIAP